MIPKEVKVARRRLTGAYITTLISITLVLFLLGLVGLLVLNAKKISDYVKENIGISVIIKEDIREADLIKLQKMLDAMPYVKTTQYITKEQAAEELKAELGEDFVQFLGYNPLLASIDVKLYAQFANADSIEWIEKQIQAFSQVKEIYYQKSLVHLVNENIKKLSIVIMSFTALMLLIAITLINNTIRLSVYSKRFIINTMQLVGATRSYIRKPFIKKGIWFGVFSSLLASVLLVVIVYLVEKELSGLITLHDIEILGLLFAGMLAIGIIINICSTYFAVTKYLRIKIDSLYL
jgi:cell division transport system permease protein